MSTKRIFFYSSNTVIGRDTRWVDISDKNISTLFLIPVVDSTEDRILHLHTSRHFLEPPVAPPPDDAEVKTRDFTVYEMGGNSFTLRWTTKHPEDGIPVLYFVVFIQMFYGLPTCSLHLICKGGEELHKDSKVADNVLYMMVRYPSK